MKRFLILLSIISLSSCALQVWEYPNPAQIDRTDKTLNAYEFLQYYEENHPGTFSMLIEALQKVGLDTLYTSNRTHTYIAMTDIAMRSFLNQLNAVKISEVNDVFLRRAILANTVDGYKLLSTSREVTFTNGECVVNSMNYAVVNLEEYKATTLSFRKYDPDYRFYVNGLLVRSSNYEPTNGALHIMDNLVFKNITGLTPQ